MAGNPRYRSEGTYEWVEDLPDELTCVICLDVAIDPHQHGGNGCGKVFCLGCINRYQGNTSVCPFCGQAQNLFQDPKSARQIRSLIVWCDNKGSGCQWTGELGSLEKHLQKCDYSLVPCSNQCTFKEKIMCVQRNQLEEHLVDHCPKRPYQCPYCGETGEHWKMTISHLETCPKMAIVCTDCQAKFPRWELPLHQFMCDCREVSCRYSEIGCKKRLPCKDMAQHEEDSKYHFQLMAEIIIDLKKEVELLKSRSLLKVKLTSFQKPSKLVKATLVTPCTFKVDNFQKRKTNNDEFYSAPFYTFFTGYKMCVRVNANGVGKGGATHISVYTYLMKGENDDSLSWPFSATVLLELLNQLANKDHYKISTVFPSDSKHSLRVTGSSKGIGLGYQKFISHSELDQVLAKNRQYLKDDTLVFRVTVNTPSVKPWLECNI